MDSLLYALTQHDFSSYSLEENYSHKSRIRMDSLIHALTKRICFILLFSKRVFGYTAKSRIVLAFQRAIENVYNLSDDTKQLALSRLFFVILATFQPWAGSKKGNWLHW